MLEPSTCHMKNKHKFIVYLDSLKSKGGYWSDLFVYVLNINLNSTDCQHESISMFVSKRYMRVVSGNEV